MRLDTFGFPVLSIYSDSDEFADIAIPPVDLLQMYRCMGEPVVRTNSKGMLVRIARRLLE
jgi:hypothetical protein